MFSHKSSNQKVLNSSLSRRLRDGGRYKNQLEFLSSSGSSVSCWPLGEFPILHSHKALGGEELRFSVQGLLMSAAETWSFQRIRGFLVSSLTSLLLEPQDALLSRI